MRKSVTFEFHLCQEARPPKSGVYLVYTSYGSFITVDYSERHGAWNCCDWQDDPETKIPYDDDYIVAWADVNNDIHHTLEATV